MGITPLTHNTTYYYSFYASNVLGGTWAGTTSFNTQTILPPVVTNHAPTRALTSSAELHGEVIATNWGSTEVWVYWGPSDGGTTKTNWRRAEYLGIHNEELVYTNITGLSAGVTYYYRFYGSNLVGGGWANSTTNFTTVAYPGNFAKKLRIYYGGYNGAETLTNFPALVRFNTGISGFDYDGFNNPTNPIDLRFGNESEEIELLYEIDTWNTNGDSYVWVQVRDFTNDCVIWAYWGSPLAMEPGYATDGSAWDRSYEAVWHMNQTNVQDSTANGWDSLGVNGNPALTS